MSITLSSIVNGGDASELEAAHIRPVADMGPDSVRNGIALSRMVHRLFDRGIISMEGDGKVWAASSVDG